MTNTKRIAMWSGPRNLSTAMMYSFGSRRDCTVIDEPFYAAYLKNSGSEHPMQSQILASQSHDPNDVIDNLLGPVETPAFYQKHMTHHMTDDVPRDWMAQVTNVFLIRHPARVVASYAKKREGPNLDDLGFKQQVALFEYAVSLGQKPIVVDSFDIRQSPEKVLRGLCAAIDLPWDDAMLSWEKGGHPNDGIWASHWYGAVHQSTGFADAEDELPKLESDYKEIAAQAMPYYDRLAAFKI